MLRLKRNVIVILLAVFLIFSVSPAMSQEIEKWIDSPGKDKYPDAHAVFLKDIIGYTVNTDGSTVLVEHEIIKILDQRGLNKFQKMSRPYVKADQSLTVEIARIIKPDGSVINLNKEKDITHQASFAKDAPIYKDLVIATLDFSKAEVNDIIEFKLVTYDRKPLIEDYFWSISFTTDEIPMELTRFYADMYRDEDKLNWFIHGLDENLKPVKKKLSGGTRYAWEWKNRPILKDEPASPAFRDRGSFIIVSTCPSWKKMSTAYYEKFEKYFEPGNKVKTKLKEIVRDGMSQAEKLIAIGEYISRLRVINVGFDPDHLILSPSDELVESPIITRYDGILLYIALLHAAGFEAYPALLSDHKSGVVREELPTPYQFNHLIARVKIDGEWKFMDPITPSTGKMSLYAGQQGCGVLPLTPEGSQLSKTPVSPPEANREVVTATAKLSEEGTIGVTINILEAGTKKIIWDLLFRAMQSPAAQNDIFGKLLGTIADDAKIMSFNSKENSGEGTLEIELTFIDENYPIESGNFWVVKLPLFAAQKSEFARQTPDDRKFPVLLGSTTLERRNLTLQIPSSFEVKSMPSDIDISNDVGALKVDCKLENGKIVYSYKFRIDCLEIPLSKYPQLHELFKEGIKAGKEVIILQKAGSMDGPTS